MTNPISCIIIDDDPFIQELLQDKLQQHFHEIEVMGVGNNGQEGIAKIAELKPNLVFLDVEMTDMTGFEMLSQLPKIDFKVIFITSYKHYAIKAIRFNALDYLLKPFDLGELKNAVRRFKESQRQDSANNTIQRALANLKSKNSADQTLVLRTQEGELYLPLKNIISVEGDRNYSRIHLTQNRSELVSKTLSTLEELLADKDFFRCHKSHLVNKLHIVSEPKALSVSLSNQTTVPVSRRKKDAFKEWYKSTHHDQ
ncbi:LytTR family DNA-binding domain-containing protein [Allomuricauda sp. SCSIO 65647]|uniref:LytR/AlgR family response regulator transcription factor n=1 Tax=Allomuricauda sp. SCSIO 65647 TaxID=2908843 RepID=UPI001F182169|nr:LytTR family DNA-binding domain-containing protein [Muricauda sp. SCSIO 65647]UJH67364.1 LytTR family DNA-binding domain-containing protein [Muricauda sp. SCSIO 65647]